jgi:hypothetical protein
MSQDQLYIWSWENMWLDRAAAWDAHLDRLREETWERATESTVQDLVRDLARDLRGVRKLGAEEIRRLRAAAREDGPPGLIQPGLAVRAVLGAAPLEHALAQAAGVLPTLDSSRAEEEALVQALESGLLTSEDLHLYRDLRDRVEQVTRRRGPGAAA